MGFKFVCNFIQEISNYLILITFLQFTLPHYKLVIEQIRHYSMGVFFDKIRNRKINVDKSLLNASGSKLREYFCSFRSICEDFTIRTREYMQIFGSNVKSFEVWDPDRSGLIDAMEMFSGLIIFSKVTYQDKIRFLYQIFDLNEEGFLEYDELAYLFINICEATCKVYQIQSDAINSQIIQQFLDEFFSEQTQLKFEDFLRWSYKTEQIIQFFQVIGHPFQPQTNTHSIDHYNQTNLQSKRLWSFSFQKENQVKVKMDERFLSIIKNDHILLQDEQKQQEFNPVMKWVYGIRVDDIRYPLHYRKTKYYKAANQKFIYICGKNVVVLYPKLNMQNNYTHHSKPVSCVEISSCDQVVASGEMGLYPSIHVWNLKTVKCIQKFDKVHKNSVKILKFLKNNELLASIGEKYNSSLIILNIKTKQKILSTYLMEPVLNIMEVNLHSQIQSELWIVLPSHIVKCTSRNKMGYDIRYNKVGAPGSNDKQKQIKIKLASGLDLGQRSMLLLVDDTDSMYAYDSITNQLHRINFNEAEVGTLAQQQSEKEDRSEKIIDIYSSMESHHIYVLYPKFFVLLHIDHHFNAACKSSISIPTNMFNLELVQLIEVHPNCVIVVSLMGDVIKVSNFSHKSECNPKLGREQQMILESIEIIPDQNEGNLGDSKKTQIEFHKYCQIFKIEKINGICFLSKEACETTSGYEKPRLVIASNSLIYVIDQIEKELLSLQCLEQNITHIHSVANTYAVATQLKYLMILRDGVTVEKTKCTDSGHGPDSVINGFKMTAETLIVGIDQQIYIYYKSNGNYLDRDSKKIKIDHGIPIHLTMTSIPKVFLVITKEKTILRLNSESKEKNLLTAKELNCDFLQTYYPENYIRSPILFSGTKKIFLLAQPNGDIYFWNSLNHLIRSQQSYSVLTGHSSSICELVFSEDGFISLGAKDGQIIIWNNQEVISQGEEEDTRVPQNVSYIEKTKQKVKFPDESTTQLTKAREQNNLKLTSQCYVEQLILLQKFTCDKLPLKDSQIEVTVKDGDLYRDLAKSINHILLPSNSDAFEPMLDRKKKKATDSEQKRKQGRGSKLLQKISLNLADCFIYGFCSEKSRQSLFYLHHYHEKKQHLEVGPKVESNNEKQKQIEFAKQLLLPINEIHNECKRSFFYFTGRVGVIWSPILKTQLQYEFHTSRITCAAVHPNKSFLCTAEISNSYPIVHVWNMDSVTLVHNFKTRHNRLISKLEFSRDGELIVSLGGPTFQQSIEIYNWVRQQVICFRCIQESCLYDIKFNPYDCNEVAVCGMKSLCVMRVSNRTLVRKEAAIVQGNEEITCMVYTSSIYGNTIESDIITGNSNGDISLFICGKYITCKRQAHEKSINCLKLCELFKYKTILISAAEDNMIKFWDTKFNQIASLNVKEVLNLNKSFNQNIKISIAPQSIDLYQCLSEKENNNIDETAKKTERIDSEAILLVGTRNGSIFEVKISNEYQGLKLFVSENHEKQKEEKIKKDLGDFFNLNLQNERSQNSQNKSRMEQKLQLNYVSHFNNMPSTFGRQALFDVKGNLMITYSKIAHFFTLWSIEKRQVIRIQKLNNYPSCIKFTKTNFVAVCYLDGRIQFLQIDSSFQFLAREQKIFLDYDYQPINIVFADNDSKIAVVFLREQQQKKLSSNNNPSIIQQNFPSEGEQTLMIYEKVLTQNNTPFNSSDKNTHCIATDKRKFKNIFWCDFSSGGSKILICYTLNYYLKLNNSNRKRMMGSFQTTRYQPLYEYILYDIARRMEKDLTNEEFNVLNFAPAVRAKYHYYTDCKVIQEYHQIEDEGHQRQGDKKKPNSNSLPSKLPKNASSGQQSLSDITHSGRLASPELVSSAIATQIVQQFVPICQMTQYQNLTLMGTIYGEVLAISSQNFYFDNSQDFSDTEQKCVKTKSFAIFDSPISVMQVVGNKLYVSAKECSTIAEFTLKTDSYVEIDEETEWRNSSPNERSQIYYQVFTVEKIENWLKYVFPKRKNFYEIKLNCQDRKSQKTCTEKCDQGEKDEISLQPYRIIGRNAFYKRNNVLIDLKENLITFSGCNLLIMTGHPENGYRYEQQFIKLDNSIFSVNPEISVITLSEDRRTLFAGTTEENCQIIIWDISSRTELEHICFKGYVSILLLKVSEKQRHAVVLALSKKAEQVIYFISLQNFAILASFCISSETYICDLAFVPGNQFKFIACGVNYMAEWTFKGGLLNCQNYSLKKPQDPMESVKKPSNTSVTFFSIIFLKDIAITSGSDGYLYLWNSKSLIKKQNANPKAAILTLYASKNSKIFASGAVDGKANIWQLGSSSIIQKVYQFSLYSGKQAVIPSKFHIQSVIIGTNEIFIGTRSGQIHRYEFISNEMNQFEENCNSKQSHSLILPSFDNDRVNSCSFNISSQKLYVLTQSGIFSVFNLTNNEKIKEEKIKVDNEQIVKMLVCKLSCKIYIIMKKGIDVYTYIEEGKYSNRFNKEKEGLRLGSTEIKSGILSLNQKYLALLMSPNHLQNAKIELYDMNQHDGKQFYVQYKVLENIPANIEIIDFSTDNGYLVYKNSDEDETIIDLTTKSQIYTKEIEFELEWNEEAKKTSKYIRDICSTYSDENKLKSIIQIMNHSVIVADEMGSLRVFRYEQNLEDNVIEYYRIYLEHLNNVCLCIISADCSLLATVGWQDRSIVLWKVKNFDLKTPHSNRNKKKSKALN